MKKYEYVVSACLAGFKCKYNGGSNLNETVADLCAKGRALPVCPETLAQLPVPREPSEILDGKVVSKSGKDLTMAFKSGAQKAFALAQASGASKAIVKSRSPSCGYGKIYDGSFSRQLAPGNGLWTEKLLLAGFEVRTEEDFPPQSPSPTCHNSISGS